MSYSWVDSLLLGALRKTAGAVPVSLSLGFDRNESSEPPSIVPLIRLKDRRALISILRRPVTGFGDMYSEGRIEVEGDLVRLLEELSKIPRNTLTRVSATLARRLPFQNTRRTSRRNIYHHYDLSNDFYQLWLDSQLVYTCAYFQTPDATLEAAQRAKLDLVCRKLWLRPGETVVEAGCGWGALALHMAKHYGVQVRAFNISREQIKFARARARREGLDSKVEFCEDDYRNIAGTCDAFVSVGMLEHVGRKHYGELGRVISRVMGKSGRGLLHFIGRNQPQVVHAWIRKRIFPGAYAPALREAMDVLEPHDFSVLDVENLRAHYARTLECWLGRFEQSYARVVDRFGPSFARMWRLYLAGSTAAFRVGSLQLFQVVFAGRSCPSMPRTREYLYEDSTQRERQDVEWIPATS